MSVNPLDFKILVKETYQKAAKSAQGERWKDLRDTNIIKNRKMKKWQWTLLPCWYMYRNLINVRNTANHQGKEWIMH